ncbi:MAG: glucosaminidase domain-containing protein [Actinomycetota bacterium]|nr:glucosaminidase domain-containing protein [Actinomycetota bacterium]
MLFFRRGRCVVAVLAALVCLSATAAGAQEAPAETPPATVPAPPPFDMPMDAGQKLLEQRDRANLAILYGMDELPKAESARDVVRTEVDRLNTRLTVLQSDHSRTVREIAASKARLTAAAADAYVHAGSNGAHVLEQMAKAQDSLDLQRDIHLIETYGRREIDVHDALVDEKGDLEDDIARVTVRRDDKETEWNEAVAYADSVRFALDMARVSLADAEEGLTKFHELATWASSPIQGPNYLTAYHLAEFVKASGTTQNITVSIEELAQFYIEESAKVGIRGDVAFAQSILETGHFGFAGSMVEPEDNNFAGIGACDSCSRGFRFEDARHGVRAQMQLLRVYTDADVTVDSLPDPLLLPGTLRLGFRGEVQSWWDLTGTWATAYDYGIRVYALYSTIVEFAKTLPPPPEPPVEPPLPTG